METVRGRRKLCLLISRVDDDQDDQSGAFPACSTTLAMDKNSKTRISIFIIIIHCSTWHL